MSGKGSKPRPFSVSQDKFAENWDRIFNKHKREQALDELANHSQKLGLYDDPVMPKEKQKS
jgi:hypothetical protein